MKSLFEIVRNTVLTALLLVPVTALAETYTYDAQGRLTRVTYDDGSFISYTYDANGTRVLAAAGTAPSGEGGGDDSGGGDSDGDSGGDGAGNSGDDPDGNNGDNSVGDSVGNGGDDSGEDGSSGGGCFIATAAYGSYFEPHVVTLRNFRDRYLLTNAPGRAFVAFYYRHSPPIADYIADRPALRALVRWSLTPVVLVIRHPVMAGLFMLVLIYQIWGWRIWGR